MIVTIDGAIAAVVVGIMCCVLMCVIMFRNRDKSKELVEANSDLVKPVSEISSGNDDQKELTPPEDVYDPVAQYGTTEAFIRWLDQELGVKPEPIMSPVVTSDSKPNDNPLVTVGDYSETAFLELGELAKTKEQKRLLYELIMIAKGKYYLLQNNAQQSALDKTDEYHAKKLNRLEQTGFASSKLQSLFDLYKRVSQVGASPDQSHLIDELNENLKKMQELESKMAQRNTEYESYYRKLSAVLKETK